MKHVIVFSVMMGVFAGCRFNEKSSQTKDQATSTAPEAKSLCGYFNDASLDADYAAWFAEHPPQTTPGSGGISVPMERTNFIEKTKNPVNFKTYEMVAAGSSPLIAQLRGSVTHLMEVGKQYCIKAEIKEDNTVLVHSVTRL